MSTRDFIEKDYYVTLGVSKDADKSAIRKAYRTLARQYHPDANAGDPKAEERFKEISEAYDVLSDDKRRQEYDEARALFGAGGGGGFGPFRTANGGGTFDLGDLFAGAGLGDLFGGAFGGRGRGPRRGSDAEAEVTIDFAEAVRGVTMPLRLTTPQTCATCSGSGARPGTSPRPCPTCNGSGQVARGQGGFAFAEPCRACRGRGALVDDPCQTCGGDGRALSDKTMSVRIPPGVHDGQRIRLGGRGQPGGHGGQPGDLYVVVHVRPHPVFGRRGDHLTVTVPVTYPEAALGATVPVPTLDGGPVSVRIPPGTTSGRTFRVKGKGVRGKDGRSGDLLATVDVAVPSKLEPAARAALEAYRDAIAGTPAADPRGRLRPTTPGGAP